MPTSHASLEKRSRSDDIGRYLAVVSRLGSKRSLQSDGATVASVPSIDITNEIAREQKLKNDNAEQDIRLKRQTLDRLFIFLTAETAVIFAFAFFQGTHWPAQFHLEEWSFKLVVTVTILQITGMLYVAVRYLFPKVT